MNFKQDIRPLSEFKRNTGEILEQLRRHGRPVVLTINGKAEMVVQDADAYQQMLEAVDRMEAHESIRQGLAAMRSGKSKPAGEVIARIKARRGLHG